MGACTGFDGDFERGAAIRGPELNINAEDNLAYAA